MTWCPPSIDKVVAVISHRGRGCALALDNTKGLKGCAVRQVLIDLGCEISVAKQAWLMRQWRSHPMLRSAVMDAVTSNDADLDTDAGDQMDDSEHVDEDTEVDGVGVDQDILTRTLLLHLSAEEWQLIRPAVSKAGAMKMVDWTDVFCRRLEAVDILARCTLKAAHHVVSRKYRHGIIMKKPGIVWGVLRCSNACRVSVRLTSVQINPATLQCVSAAC